MILGYARVSTTGQSLDGQLDALEAEGCGRVFSEAVSGSVRARPELDRMLDQLRKGDVVVVTRYDRLARSLRDLLDIVARIGEAGAGFRSLAEAIDTTTPTGRLVLHVFASLAEFERELIADRTREGLAAARARGRVGGAAVRAAPGAAGRSATHARGGKSGRGDRDPVPGEPGHGAEGSRGGRLSRRHGLRSVAAPPYPAVGVVLHAVRFAGHRAGTGRAAAAGKGHGAHFRPYWWKAVGRRVNDRLRTPDRNRPAAG